MHSTDPTKDIYAFVQALTAHRERNGNNFRRFVFPADATFERITFGELADFRGATFSKGVDFNGATFRKGAAFGEATFGGRARFPAIFSEEASFNEATFGAEATFSGATFSKGVDFNGATFRKGAYFGQATFGAEVSFNWVTFSAEVFFGGATFGADVDFHGAIFAKGGSFSGAMFSGVADFHRATFSGKTHFAGGQLGVKTGYIFTGTEVDFRRVVMNPPDAVTFLEADLTRCRFLETDLRKVQLVGVTWPGKGRHTVVYDDIAPVDPAERIIRPWSQIEQLYRELKQNYEDRRDYERAGDFHYGEKEIRRQNPETSSGLRLFLTLYWLFSGYGERYRRPLLWAGLLFVLSTIGYMWWGLRPKAGGPSLAWINVWDWLRAGHYSFRVMTLLKPDDWVPLRYAQVINTVQTLLGPTFLGLFALALRQRLKR